MQDDVRSVARQALRRIRAAHVDILPNELFPPIPPGPDTEVIAGDDGVPALEQEPRHRRADQPGSACHEDEPRIRQTFRSWSGIGGANVTSSDARCSSYLRLNH